MTDIIYALIAGFLAGFGIMFAVAINLFNATNRDLRAWRREAIKLRHKVAK
jgi:hypothetical protein